MIDSSHMCLLVPFLALTFVACDDGEGRTDGGFPDGGTEVFHLAVKVTGNGTAALNPVGGEYKKGTVVEVAAEPSELWRFDRWEGDLHGGANPGSVVMTADKNVTAVFVQISTAPTVTYMQPYTAPNTGTVEIDDLGGTGFRPGATVRLVREDQPEITALSVTVASETRIKCSFDLSEAAVGQWDVVVTNIDGLSGVLPSGFTVSMVWIQAKPNDANGFSPRACPNSVVFGKKMWVIGGQDSTGTNLVDVWSSTDGAAWKLEAEKAPFASRIGGVSLVFDGKIWLIGGQGLKNDKVVDYNDVWSTQDGTIWTQVKPNDESGFPPRWGSSCVAYDGKMWVLGGYGGKSSTWLNDVWYSTDGVTWIEAKPDDSNGFPARSDFPTFALHGKMWVIGGEGGSSGNASDVWSSTGGETWTEEKPDDYNGFPGRYLHTGVVTSDGRMWIIGGTNQHSACMNDAWYSTDGKSWKRAAQPPYSTAVFSGRFCHTSVVFDGKIWVIAGIVEKAPRLKNDVWFTH